jgi:hypothetical protein
MPDVLEKLIGHLRNLAWFVTQHRNNEHLISRFKGLPGQSFNERLVFAGIATFIALVPVVIRVKSAVAFMVRHVLVAVRALGIALAGYYPVPYINEHAQEYNAKDHSLTS